MKKRCWGVSFILIIVIVLGLIFCYKILGLGGPSYKCETTFADGKIALLFYNTDIINKAEEVLRSNNLTYKEPHYFYDEASISIDVPIGEEENYIQKIKKKMIENGLSSDDFSLERSILVCAS